MTSTFDINNFLQKREFLKKRFEVERTGEQKLFTTQEKLFKPLIESQKETSKAIENKISANQDILSNTLVPFTRELQKRNDQMDALQTLPFFNVQPGIEDVPQSTPKKDVSDFVIDLDKMLNDTDRGNLQDMNLPLPSEVIKQGNYESILKQIETENRRCGQYTGKKSKKNEEEKQKYKSRRETLEMYKLSLEEQKKALKYKSGDGLNKHKLCKQKRGKGRPRKYHDIIFYKNPNELCQILYELHTAKQAGNTGLDNKINSVLDELLDIKFITKDEYDKLFINVFG
jgi:hypothetical protein